MVFAKDLVGKELKGFKILDWKKEKGRAYLLAVCPFCHCEKWIRKDTIDNPKVVSCGCYNKKHNYKKADNIKGQTFGRLKAIKPTEKTDNNGSIVWECECDCGNTTYVSIKNLKAGDVKSCGCLGKENSQKNGRHAGQNTREKYCIEGTNVASLTAKMPKNNKSGIKGVYWDATRCKWVAQIGFKRHNYRLGRFDNIEDAAEARRIAEKELFGNFLEWYYKEYPERKK